MPGCPKNHNTSGVHLILVRRTASPQRSHRSHSVIISKTAQPSTPNLLSKSAKPGDPSLGSSRVELGWLMSSTRPGSRHVFGCESRGVFRLIDASGISQNNESAPTAHAASHLLVNLSILLSYIINAQFAELPAYHITAELPLPRT
uniref:Uncharacterized protein n=1 Tax=Talaromyces marneffei PM1 TaxID=1077442 RepID=A0A093VDY0_TALMA